MPQLLNFLYLLITLPFIFCAHQNKYRCPTGWDINGTARRCYKLVNRPMPQIYAAKYCHALDRKSKMVRIQDEAENDFVRGYTYSGDIWLGAKARFDIIDTKAELFSPGLVLRWKNGKPVKYTNWEKQNGFNGMDKHHLCVVMNSRGKWVNAECQKSAKFVCERRLLDPLVSIDDISGDCPRKWTNFPETGGCYRSFTGVSNLTWLDADKLCGDAGAATKEDVALASIGSAAENKFVMDLARRRLPNWQHIFLGAIGDTKSKKHWDWVDGKLS
uniref:C-type lectin domain-containing protein n=1 Tax=Panagrellus redivivus TaxID=6233 RepID=A0A7E4US59_PANRE